MAVSRVAPSQAIVLEGSPSEKGASPLAVGSWALYDFANTIFSLNIISVYFPQFIVKDLKLNDAIYAYPMSAALLVVALIMPALGAFSDRPGGRRMPWLVATTLMAVGMTALMGVVSELSIIILALVLANIGYQTALIFYDALLPSVSTTANWGKVSGLGVGVGYAGALVGGFAVQQLIGKEAPAQQAFVPTALMFLLFAIPCFLFVRERRADTAGQLPPAARPTLQGSLTQTVRSLRATRETPGLFTFLVANFFYSDALNTVIIAMGVYATQVIGFGSAFDVLAPAIVAAVVGSLLFGLVTDWLTSKQALVLSLLLWVGVFVAAMFVTDKVIFQYVIAPVAGIALGSTWTAARTIMIELSPPARLGEYLGLYNLTGKFSAVLGPLLWGTTLLVLDPRTYGRSAYQVAIGTLLLMVIVGLVLHLRTPNIARRRTLMEQ
ncbi:MAG TPA: MFS transporter [Chloroflexia bacterium]|nr:MFS transporter [Chloroflexia bacterium]